MDNQEILIFTNLYIKFQERCKHIAKILYEYDHDFEEDWGEWSLDYDQNNVAVSCYKDVDLYAYGCHVDSRNLYFPIELLSADDAQIYEYASNKYKKVSDERNA